MQLLWFWGLKLTNHCLDNVEIDHYSLHLIQLFFLPLIKNIVPKGRKCLVAKLLRSLTSDKKPNNTGMDELR